MSGSNGDLLPFDGKCDLSRDADLKIAFSQDAPLKAHSEHLKQASTVLKIALEDCKHGGTLAVGDDDRDAWVFLLNLVHPGRRMAHLEQRYGNNLSRMERYAALAHKYDVHCLMQYVICDLCFTLNDETIGLPRSVASFDAQERLSKVGKLFGCCRIAVKFELETTKRSVLAHLDQLFQGMAFKLHSHTGSHQQMNNAVADFVVQVSLEGDVQFALQIAEKALRLLRC